MSDAITPTLRDSIMYWAPAGKDSTGQEMFNDPVTVQRVRVDDSVAKEVRDLLQGINVSATVWSLIRFQDGGWLCRVADFNLASVANTLYPQLIVGAKQIVNIGSAKSWAGDRVFWRHVI